MWLVDLTMEPSASNNAYNINHSENCNDNINCNLTKYDCDDVFNGLAFYDLCNICSGGAQTIIQVFLMKI